MRHLWAGFAMLLAALVIVFALSNFIEEERTWKNSHQQTR